MTFQEFAAEVRSVLRADFGVSVGPNRHTLTDSFHKGDKPAEVANRWASELGVLKKGELARIFYSKLNKKDSDGPS